MAKTISGCAALMALMCGSAWGQSPSQCNELYSISACNGDGACIREAQRARETCRASEPQGGSFVLAVAEPATILLLASGLIAIAVARRRRRDTPR